MKRLTMLAFVSFGHVCLSQDDKSIAGSVKSEMGESLPYASVYLKHSTHGTVTNLMGEFELKASKLSKLDTLCVSHIGYQTFQIPVNQINSDGCTVTLKEAVVTLAAIEILPIEYLKNPNKIVRNAISNIRQTTNDQPHVLKAFYRHVNSKDDEYLRLLEAAISIYDSGYKTNFQQFGVNELRKSYDNRKPDNKKVMSLIDSLTKERSSYSIKLLKSGFDGIFQDTTTASSEELMRWENNYKPLSLQGLHYTDYVRHYQLQDDDRHFGILNNSFTKEHNFKLDTVMEYDDNLVYVVKILPSSRSKRYRDESRKLIFPVGKIFIRTSDFAILRIEYSYILNPKKKGTSDYNFRLKSLGSGIVFTSTVIYREYEGRMYLSYLKRSENDPIAFSLRKRKLNDYRTEHYYITRELLITDIVTKKNDVEYCRKHIINSVSDLYRPHFQYNEKFWANYGVLKETPVDEKLRKNLEKQLSLNEQFKQTNKR